MKRFENEEIDEEEEEIKNYYYKCIYIFYEERLRMKIERQKGRERNVPKYITKFEVEQNEQSKKDRKERV